MENKNSDMKVNSNINENKVSLILDLRKNGINNSEILRVIERLTEVTLLIPICMISLI